MKGSSAAAQQTMSIGTALGRWGNYIPTADGQAVKQRRDAMYEAGLSNPTTQAALKPLPVAPAPAAPSPAPAPAAPTVDSTTAGGTEGSTKKKKKTAAGTAPEALDQTQLGFKSLLGE